VGDEANVPALGGPAQADPRVPRADAQPRRPRGDPGAPREGSDAARGLTGGRGAARLRLARPQRLGAAAVASVFKRGRLTRAARLYLYRLPNDLARPRLALVVPKRLAPRATTRNRIRRLIREAFRLQQRRLGGADCVVRLVKPTGDAPITREEVEKLLILGVEANA
jgi:ribonuclease P protein component